MNYKNFDDSFLKVFDAKNNIINGGLLYRVPASIKDGFNFEYLIFIPNNVKEHSTLILEGTNYETFKTKDENERIECLCEEFEEFKDSIHYSNSESNFPILYPLIPGYYDEKIHQEVYTHILSSDSLKIENKFKRVDKQIINMINDVKRRLYDNDIILDERIILYGFSFSGMFANRFALLHPGIVKLIIAGGLDGILILPFKKYKNMELMYPIGIDGVDEINDYKIIEFLKIKQFYYQDINDKVDFFDSKNGVPLYDGVITSFELRWLYSILGRKIETRWKNSRMIYKKICKNIIFRTYNYGKHSDEVAKELIKKLLNGEI